MQTEYATRALLALAAVGAIAVTLVLDLQQRACDEAIDEFFAAVDAGPAGVDSATARINADCEPGRIVDVGFLLNDKREHSLAARVLREATAREPDNFSAWAGLARALSGSDPAGAREAAARARALNPRYPPPS